ncbi:MAG TPA: 3-methyladenine DNA glycosylase [Bacillus bacterium]|nr:3-methyladenine DNA glycosylase [Bacillus sp. (in: firmicutes)]
MSQKNEHQNDGSLEQEKKQEKNKDIEPQRDPVKPQEETKKNK